MGNWKQVKIGDICKTNAQAYSVSENWPFVNYLDTGNITENRIEGFQRIELVNSSLPSRARRKVAVNDIIYSTVRPNQRHYGIIKKMLPNMLVSTGFTVITVDTKFADADFLYYFLTQNDIVNSLHAIGEQSVSAYPSIKSKDIENLEIMLPPLKIQKEIGRTLQALDDKIANNTRINHHLEQMAQAIFKSWFDCYDPSQPFTNAVQVLGGGTPKTGNESYWNGEIPFFTPKDTGSLYVLSTEKRLSEAGLSNCNSRLYPVNTVFVTARGTVGKLALAGCPMAMNQSCYALVSNGDYGQFYVYHLALTVVEKLKRKANGAVFDAIVTRDFENELVPAPATKEIKAFEDKIQPIFETILNNCKENVRLAELRDTLLPRLMSGELSVADLGDGK